MYIRFLNIVLVYMEDKVTRGLIEVWAVYRLDMHAIIFVNVHAGLREVKYSFPDAKVVTSASIRVIVSGRSADSRIAVMSLLKESSMERSFNSAWNLMCAKS